MMAFTVAQIADALGAEAPEVREALSRAAGAVALAVRGQLTKAWPLPALPARLADQLDARAAELGYRDAEHLLSSPGERWQPAKPVARLEEPAVAAAEVRQMVLAPLMPSLAGASISATAKRALALWPANCNPPTDRTVREWISRAVKRDAGRGEWNRLELFLDEAAAGDRGQVPARADSPIPTTAEGEAALWSAACATFARRLAEGATERQAKAGVLATLRKGGRFGALAPDALRKAFERKLERWKEGDEALQDRRAQNPGRAPLIDAASISETDRRAIKRLALKTGSKVLALEIHAASPECSEELSEAILRKRASIHNMPDSLVRLAKVTEEAKLYDRGSKEYQLDAFTVYRDNTELMPDGTRRIIEPGDYWEADDMSVNQPFWYEVVDGEDELAKRHGVGMGRQGLFSADVATGRWLGCELIGRPRDAYRVEDILSFFRKLFQEHGLPRRGLRLERGIWKSKAIAGKASSWLTPEQEDELMGGLRQLGVRVVHAHNAKGKGLIETNFNHLQRVASTMDAPSFGRWRGERSRDCQKIIRAQAGIVHPEAIGSLYIDEMAARMDAFLAFCNSRNKEGRIQAGIPDVRWAQSMEQSPLKRLPIEKLFLFLPVKKELQLKAGHVTTKVDGREIRFAVEDAVWLGSGYRVVLCFDPTDPAAGAVILNNEAGALNERNLKPWEYIGPATLADFAPQFAPTGYADSNITRRKTMNRSFRTSFVAPGLFGKNGSSASELRDGRGAVARASRGKQFEGFEGTRKDGAASEGERLIAESVKSRKAREAAEQEERARLFELAKEEAAQRLAEEEWLQSGGYASDLLERFHRCKESGALFGLPKKHKKGRLNLDALISETFASLVEAKKARQLAEEVAQRHAGGERPRACLGEVGDGGREMETVESGEALLV